MYRIHCNDWPHNTWFITNLHRSFPRIVNDRYMLWFSFKYKEIRNLKQNKYTYIKWVASIVKVIWKSCLRLFKRGIVKVSAKGSASQCKSRSNFRVVIQGHVEGKRMAIWKMYCQSNCGNNMVSVEVKFKWEGLKSKSYQGDSVQELFHFLHVLTNFCSVS